MKENFVGHMCAREGRDGNLYVAHLCQHRASVNAEFLLCREFQSRRPAAAYNVAPLTRRHHKNAENST